MSLRRALTVLANDLRLAARSSLLWALIASPLVITGLRALVRPSRQRGRLAVLDHGRSSVASGFDRKPGFRVRRAKSVAELRRLVDGKKVHAGLVFTEDFDREVRAGERPALEFYLSGEVHALKRLVLAATTIDLVRRVEGKAPPVKVVTKVFGGKRSNTTNFLILFMTFYVTMTAGVFVPALQFVEGREQGTLRAFLVTPGRMSEVLVARALSGLAMTLVLSFAVLAVNLKLSAGPGVLLLPLTIAAVLSTELGLIFGTVLRDTRAAGGVAAGLQVLVLGAMFVSLGVGWDPWLGKLIPTYWLVGPLFEVTVNGVALRDLKVELAVGLAMAAAMAVAIVLLGRRMEERLATG